MTPRFYIPWELTLCIIQNNAQERLLSKYVLNQYVPDQKKKKDKIKNYFSYIL